MRSWERISLSLSLSLSTSTSPRRFPPNETLRLFPRFQFTRRGKQRNEIETNLSARTKKNWSFLSARSYGYSRLRSRGETGPLPIEIVFYGRPYFDKSNFSRHAFHRTGSLSGERVSTIFLKILVLLKLDWLKSGWLTTSFSYLSFFFW